MCIDNLRERERETGRQKDAEGGKIGKKGRQIRRGKIKKNREEGRMERKTARQTDRQTNKPSDRETWRLEINELEI